MENPFKKINKTEKEKTIDQKTLENILVYKDFEYNDISDSGNVRKFINQLGSSARVYPPLSWNLISGHKNNELFQLLDDYDDNTIAYNQISEDIVLTNLVSNSDLDMITDLVLVTRLATVLPRLSKYFGTIENTLLFNLNKEESEQLSQNISAINYIKNPEYSNQIQQKILELEEVSHRIEEVKTKIRKNTLIKPINETIINNAAGVNHSTNVLEKYKTTKLDLLSQKNSLEQEYSQVKAELLDELEYFFDTNLIFLQKFYEFNDVPVNSIEDPIDLDKIGPIINQFNYKNTIDFDADQIQNPIYFLPYFKHLIKAELSNKRSSNNSTKIPELIDYIRKAVQTSALRIDFNKYYHDNSNIFYIHKNTLVSTSEDYIKALQSTKQRADIASKNLFKYLKSAQEQQKQKIQESLDNNNVEQVFQEFLAYNEIVNKYNNIKSLIDNKPHNQEKDSLFYKLNNIFPLTKLKKFEQLIIKNLSDEPNTQSIFRRIVRHIPLYFYRDYLSKFEDHKSRSVISFIKEYIKENEQSIELEIREEKRRFSKVLAQAIVFLVF